MQPEKEYMQSKTVQPIMNHIVFRIFQVSIDYFVDRQNYIVK